MLKFLWSTEEKMLNNPGGPQTLSEATAIRLYNSIVASNNEERMAAAEASATAANLQLINSNLNSMTNSSTTNTTITSSFNRIGEEAIIEQKSIESIRSCNEFGNSCRICRWNRSDMQILQCPCHCKGSVVSKIFNNYKILLKIQLAEVNFLVNFA